MRPTTLFDRQYHTGGVPVGSEAAKEVIRRFKEREAREKDARKRAWSSTLAPKPEPEKEDPA
jgi:hypothetical protein